MVEIVFTDLTGMVAEEYRPRPASKAMPDWFLNLPAFNAPEKRFDTQTGKRCVPLMDAFSSGYMIVTPMDIRVFHDKDGQLVYQWPSEFVGKMDFQQKWQVGDHAGIGERYAAIPKMPNPWGVKTPAGYSCLFIPPVNQDKRIFEVFSGVIDTDAYSVEGGFPFRLIDPEFEGVIPAGTPMVQVIPFRRESYSMRLGDDSDRKTQREQLARVRSVFLNGYRRLFWRPKAYR